MLTNLYLQYLYIYVSHTPPPPSQQNKRQPKQDICITEKNIKCLQEEHHFTVMTQINIKQEPVVVAVISVLEYICVCVCVCVCVCAQLL